MNTYYIIYNNKVWMGCHSREECKANIENLNPPSIWGDFTIAHRSELTIEQTRKD